MDRTSHRGKDTGFFLAGPLGPLEPLGPLRPHQARLLPGTKLGIWIKHPDIPNLAIIESCQYENGNSPRSGGE